MVSLDVLAGGGLLVMVVLATALLSVERPPLTGRTVLAATPWVVVAAGIHTLATLGAYPATLTPYLTFPAAFVVTYVVAALTWTPLLQLAAMRDFSRGSGTYLAVAGTATAAIALFALVVWRGLSGSGLLWLSATPLLAALLATVAVLALGVFDVTAIGATRLTGFLLVFAYALLGVATAVTARVYEVTPGGLLGRRLLEAARELPAAGPAGHTWPVALAVLLAGVLLTSAVARVVRRDETVGLAALFALSTAALGTGTGHLLVTVFG